MVKLQSLLNLKVQLIVYLVLHFQIVELKEFLLKGRLRTIVVSDKSTQGTRNEIERDYAGKHESDTEYALSHGASWDVTVTDSRHGCHNIVHWRNIKVKLIVIEIRFAVAPNAIRLFVELREENEQTATDVKEENGENPDENQSFNSRAQHHRATQLREYLILSFQKLE